MKQPTANNTTINHIFSVVSWGKKEIREGNNKMGQGKTETTKGQRGKKLFGLLQNLHKNWTETFKYIFFTFLVEALDTEPGFLVYYICSHISVFGLSTEITFHIINFT